MKSLAIEHLALIASAPDGVKKLRELILQLAVMGKLVPQDPKDEPASELLKRLRQNRKKVLTASDLQEAKTMLQKLDGLLPAVAKYSIPRTWEFVRVIDLAMLMVDCHNKTAPYVARGIPIIRTSNIRNRAFRMNDLKFVDRDTYDFWSRRCPPAPEDIIFTREAPMGEAAIIPDGEIYCLGQRTMLIRPMHGFVNNRYLLFALTEPGLLSRAVPAAVGATVKHLRVGDVEGLEIALPPLAEQHRIVAKVDELMALCDKLEAQENDSEAAHSLLVKTLLDTLTQTQDADDFAASWARIKENFHTLFTTEESVDILKQTLLQLAVMGKLVPQDPNDEPASELLKRIRNEKLELGLAPHSKESKEITGRLKSSRHFSIPATWLWVKLSDLLIFGPRNGYSPKGVDRVTPVKSITLGATSSGSFDPTKFKYVDESIESDSHLWLREHDVLIQRGNSRDYVGIAAVYRGERDKFIYPDLMMKIRASTLIDVEYLHIALNCRSSRMHFMSSASGTSDSMPKIDQSIVVNHGIPLPPLAEQHRIVAKVDELMALCDKLKLEIQAADRLQDKLSSAMLQRSVDREPMASDSKRKPVLSKA